MTNEPPTSATDAADVHVRPRRRFLYGVLGATTLVAVSLAALTVAWYVDEDNQTAVVRNVNVAGTNLGGLEPAEASLALDALEVDLLARPVALTYDGGELDTTLGGLGATIDRDAVLAEALEQGRTGVFPVRQFRWLGTFAGSKEIPLVMNVDPTGLFGGVLQLGGEAVSNPIEPVVTGTGDGSISLTPGSVGYALDLDGITAHIEDIQPVTQGVIVVPVNRTVTEPQVSNTDAEAFVADLDATLPAAMAVSTPGSAGAESFAVPGTALRSWLRGEITEAGALEAALDTELAKTDLAALSIPVRASNDDPHFEVNEANTPLLVAGNALACCDDAGTQQIFDAALAGESTASVELSPVGDSGARYTELAGFGITEEISTFTTNYSPGQSRVTNIRHIAELTRGYVIEPGGYFSVNEYIGKRTRENGFVGAGVIYSGRYTEDVGGGISQYATTMFNAAYYAGLEMEEYQSHSLYISRYPYGREATLSFPAPDLKIRNDTPYGVLIWPTTTSSSITVQMFSTKYVDATEAFQSTSKSGVCTVVTSHREKRYVDDGRVENDSTQALYRPREGVDCNGNETRQVD